MDLEQISIWISERRFAPFLERAEGERAVAVELYLWQARVAGARVREVLGRLEREGYPRKRSRVVAGLPFSFWKGLFARRYEERLERRLEEMIKVASVIDPVCGEWLATHTEMTALLKQRPVGE